MNNQNDSKSNIPKTVVNSNIIPKTIAADTPANITVNNHVNNIEITNEKKNDGLSIDMPKNNTLKDTIHESTNNLNESTGEVGKKKKFYRVMDGNSPTGSGRITYSKYNNIYNNI
jgi:hypothetical protein